jgi:hypothetical protein
MKTLRQVLAMSKATGRSLEQIHFEQTGREVRHAAPTFAPVKRSVIKRIGDAAWQAVVQRALRFQADAQAAKENREEEAARNSDEVRAEIFPWERN